MAEYRDYKLCLRSREELNFLKLLVIMSDKMKASVNSSSYHWNIIKCRQLIFENHQLIAYPKAQFSIDHFEIHVLLPKEETNFEEFNNYLHKLHIIVLSDNNEITCDVYEAALMYTIKARMAPYWNYVQDYFVQGRNFLFNTDDHNCIKLNISINENDVASFDLKPFSVRIHRKLINQIDIERELLADFIDKKSDMMIPFKYNDKKIKTLPNLTQGTILSITHRIPDNSSFSSYDQLRRYWKNLYGYRLPPTDDQLLFYQIIFWNGDTIFTYPNVCLATNTVKSFNTVDKKFLATDFLICFEGKIKRILNQPLTMYRNQLQKLDENNNMMDNQYDMNNNEIIGQKSEVVNQDEHIGAQHGKLTNQGNMDFNLGDLTTYSVRTLQEKLKIFYQDNFNLRHEVFLLRENIKTMSKFNEFELAKQIQYLQQENEEKYKSIEEKNKLLKTLMEVIEQKEDELNTQMSKNSQLTNDMERLRNEGTPIRSEIDIASLELQVQEHGKCTEKEQYYVQEIHELSQLKDVQHQRIQQLKLQLNDKDSVEDQLHSEIGQLKSRLGQFESRLDLANVCYDENQQLKSQLDSLKATVTLRDETIAELNLKISQIEEMHRQNKLMKNDSGIMFSEPDIVSSSSEKFGKVDFVKDNRNIVENVNKNRLTPPASHVDFNRLLQQKDDEKNKALEIANKLIEYFEDLWKFLVKLFKKKEFSQLVNDNEYASLKSFVEQSLDISRKLTTSLSMSVTNDCNLTELIEIIDQSKSFDQVVDSEREDNDDNIQNLRDKIEMLKIEIQLRDDNVKIVANETMPVNLAAPLMLPPIVDHSESETWSEPDRQVSSERMGIVDDYFKNVSSKIPKIKYRHSWNNEILSSSTDEEFRLNKITEQAVQKSMWMLKEEISNLNKKFQAKCQEVNKLKAINKEHERIKSDLEASLNKSLKELQELKKSNGQDLNFEKVEELANRVESVQKLKQKYIQKYQEFKRIISDMEQGHKNQTVDLKNTIVDLQKNLDSLTLTASQAAIERTKVISENHKLKEDLRVVCEKMQTIEDDFKAERNDRQHQIVQFEQNEMKLEIRISELEFVNATLKNQLTALQNDKKTMVSNSVASSPIKLPEQNKNESSDYFSEDNHHNECGTKLPSRYSASLKNNNEKREAELLAENCELKEQLQQSKQSLVNTLRQLELSNERRKAVETAVCNKMKKYGKKVTVAKQNFKLLTNKKPTEEG